ncbi:MAG: transaldolase [Candidatus Magasanikbacteria bacterium CG11_big_fil_rev_8_21_14_0_20_39_34]|uniref:Transaldolase n=1 Tax=Candidatus Magasanikbacteria bacterium CG11_big_fil_rev_8_21_14_0_20_39_34 TaxID=1974653 RepID=A0A2H0N680_9BACT|nr:MAG: transaldolase [Candidatus Magasanikbacteria bacterium CG11_big_fil_rev_8_21_14_0_20_39_34]
MRPQNLKTRIFLDSGDPLDTKEVMEKLGFLDGQTTNPSLVAKNPQMQEKIASGQSLTSVEVNDFYKGVVQEISKMVPEGSVSIEVYADADTSSEEMLSQAREMNTWIPNGHIKFPTISAGLEAAEQFVQEDHGRVNMTLIFSQQQSAAVYAATVGAQKGDVFLSPFVGRLDDIGINGMSLIENVIQMYRDGDSHVEILVASVRNLDHFLYALALGVDIITAPKDILLAWAEHDLPIPGGDYVYDTQEREDLDFLDIQLDEDWTQYDIHHDLTDKGLARFADDWNKLIGALN